MKIITQLILIMGLLITPRVWAASFTVDTAASSFKYLQSDSCSFNDANNAVTCKSAGVFQNVKKVTGGTASTGQQLIGSFVDATNKRYDLYATTPQHVIKQTTDLLAAIKATAAVLFNPVDVLSSTTNGPVVTKPNPYSIASLNEKAVNALCGPQGLNLDAKLIQYFKNFYFYLEYVTRLEYAARIAALAAHYNIDMATILDKKSWPDFVQTVQAKAGSWNNLEKALFQPTITPNYLGIMGYIQATSWDELTTSPFWVSLNTITQSSIIKSSFWQKYSKYMVTRSFVQDQTLLLSIKEVEETIFKYIPNIEVAYYNPDFTALRNATEMFHISLLLTDAQRLRIIPSCIDWSMLKDAQNTVDLTQIYTASLEFKQTPFYSIAAMAEDNSQAVYTSVEQNKVSVDINLFKQEPLLQEELILLSMIKVLHGLTNYLYDTDHLEKTMDVLANKNIIQPIPSIFIYAPEDFLYLEDLNLLHNNFKQLATNTTPATTTEQKKQVVQHMMTSMSQQKSSSTPKNVEMQFGFSDLWNGVKDSAESTWDVAKSVGQEAVSFAEDAGKKVAKEAEQLGFGKAVVMLAGMSIKDAQHLLDSAKKIEESVASEIKDGMKTASNFVTDLQDEAEKGIKKMADAITGGCETVTLHFDSELCKSIGGAIQSVADIVVTGIAGDVLMYLKAIGGMIQLTADGIDLIATTAVDVVSGNWGAIGGDLKNGLLSMAADAAVVVLEPLLIQFKYFMQQLMNAIQFCQYFISILTRIFIDATTAVAYALGAEVSMFGSLFGVNINPSDWADTVDTALSEHERLIGTCITTALLLATVPLTGGASIPLLVMTLGPQLFAIYGSYQDDQLAIEQKQEEKEFVQSFSTYVQNNKVIVAQQQQDWAAELHDKYESELENQERGLGFYENLLAHNFEALKEQMSTALGSYWSQLFTPDSLNEIPAQVGSLYGFNTNVYELNPSQGFSLYSAARNSFSQEIAVYPAIAVPGQGGSFTTVAETKNWFNQKEIAILDTDASEVEVRIKPLYILTTFHVGLYFGGEFIDIDAVKKTKEAPIDFAHLAKMAVFKKEDQNKPVSFGIYEHEGNGWLANSVTAPAFQLGQWYHIKMRLSGTNLSVKIWAEPETEPATDFSYTVTVSPSQKIIGVISSGASVEYQFINPAVTITPIPTSKPPYSLRPADKFCALPCDYANATWQSIAVERDREQIARGQMDYLTAPQAGITIVDKSNILRGQYMYTTNATNLVINGKNVEDYVVMCNMQDIGTTPSVVPQSIGQPLSNLNQMPGTPYLASLISENTFDFKGNSNNMNLTDLFSTYSTQFGPFNDTLYNQLQTARKEYKNQALSFTFGSFKLQAIASEIPKNIFIYTTPLVDENGKPIKDAKGTQLTDYFLLTEITSGPSPSYSKKRGNPGISYSTMLADKSVQYGVISLISGNLYGSSSAKPVSSGFSRSILLRNFNQHNQLDPAIKATIETTQTAYDTYVNVQENTPTPNTGSASQGTNPSDAGTKTDHKGTGTGNPVPPQPPANNSIQQRTNDASGGQITFGGPP